MQLADFSPPFGRSEDDIRANMDAAANTGLAPGDPEYVDPRPLTTYWLATQPMVIALARAHDRMNEIAATATVGTAWDEYLDNHAESYGDARVGASRAVGIVRFTSTAESTDPVLVASNTPVGVPQTDPDIDPPTFETTESGTIPPGGGYIDLAVRAQQEGEIGNVAALQISVPLIGVDGLASVTNLDATGGGAEVESDPAIRERLQLLFKGGRANKAAYAVEALRQPGVGGVTVMPHRDGAGTVTLVVVDDVRNAIVPAVLDAVQEHFDPLDRQGEGEGWAPVNHFVTIETPDNVPIYISATLQFEAGYSLDQTGGTFALRDQIEQRINEYVDGLEAGEDVIYNHVLAQFFRVKGVHNVTNLRVDTVSPPVAQADIPIQDGAVVGQPVQIASTTLPDGTSTITLS